MDLFSYIQKPTLLLDEGRARRNIQRMAAKAAANGVRFRPHFKTHQSADVGEWFREAGVAHITVSSIDMAVYFTRNGWSDITIAFPANIRQMETLNDLARQVHLNLVVESTETAHALGQGLRHEAFAWLKVDIGYGRTGILWDDTDTLVRVAAAVSRSRPLTVRGLLTHAGHTYGAGSTERISEIYQESVSRLGQSKEAMAEDGRRVELSVGDTPGCSIVPRFGAVDEVRPGNFVFYDVAQWSFGACDEEDIAVAVACPVVAKHRLRRQLVVHGGAIHLSKESIPGGDGRPIYGRVATPVGQGWSPVYEESAVTSLSQEHGIVQAEPALLNKVEVGDLLIILPIHSCLTANLMRQYLTLEGHLLKLGRF